jgi:ABC-type multidrug transport system fused ATPase/permease subunit
MNAYDIFILVMKILGIVMGFFILCQIYNLLKTIAIHIATKTESVKLYDRNNMIIRLEARVNSTNAVLNLIDTMVKNEVVSSLKTYARLGETYKTLKTVDDIEAISQKIFNAIKKEIFNENDTVLTDEYLMTYINEQTTLVFMIESRSLTTQQ